MATPSVSRRRFYMSNKTLIPAFQCAAGEDKYYVCKLTFAEVARRVGSGNISHHETCPEMRSVFHLLAPIVATCDGSPLFTPMVIDDSADRAKALGACFGVLTLDGADGLTAVQGESVLSEIVDRLRRDRLAAGNHVCVIIIRKRTS
jgi:hypothetical protein